VLPITLPPLRSHAEDIPGLIAFYIDSFNREFKKQVTGTTPAAQRLLEAYGWPGNIRELRNIVERAMLLSEHEVLDAADFAMLVGRASPNGSFELPAHGVNLEQLERSLVVQALERSGGNQTRAATLLGLNRDQIRYRIEKFGLVRA
jgi:DNA-binding NtrC family response regulator